MSEISFEQALAEYNKEWKDAEEMSNWMPPDDDYVVIVTKKTEGTSAKKDAMDRPIRWWRLTLKIDDVANPKVHGKDFPLLFRSTGLGFFKTAAKVLNGGKTVGSLVEADAILSNSLGYVLDVRIKTVKADNDREYTNCYVQKVISSVTTEEAVSESAEPVTE